MGRLNKTGVRGLVRETVIDPKSGEEVERWSIDLRYRDAEGHHQRYRERLADGIKAAAAKKRAQDVNNAAAGGKLQTQSGEQHLVGKSLDAVYEWAKTNVPASVSMYKTQVAALKKSLGELTVLDSLTNLSLETFKKKRKAEMESKAGDEADHYTGAATVNRGLSVLWRSCSLWVEWGWMRETTEVRLRKVEALKEPPGRVRWLTPEEEGVLMASLPKQVIQIAAADAIIGARRSEIVLLKKSQIDWEAREINIIKSKTGKLRQIPINDQLAEILKTAMAQSTSEYVFTNSFGKPYHPDSVTHAFVRTCKKHGIVNLRWHDLRHHAATMLRRAGHDLDVVKDLLGHSHISMSARYAHVGRKKLHEAMASVPRIAQHNGQPGGGDDRKLKAV